MLERLCRDVQPVRAGSQRVELERSIGRCRDVQERRALRRPHCELGARDTTACFVHDDAAVQARHLLCLRRLGAQQRRQQQADSQE